MDSFNPKKRYNQFRQARQKKNKFAVTEGRRDSFLPESLFAVAEINTDEATGRHFKLERFLKDCVTYLPKQEVEPFETEVTANDAEPAATASKPRRAKHIKLPVLNECKGIFENVIIGRSAKKGGNFAWVGATPEDRARLEEDIHALAKVGPDSELSFEMIPPTQQQQGNVNRLSEGQENNQETEPVRPPSPKDSSRLEVVIPPVPVREEMQIDCEDNQNRAFPEDVNPPSDHQNYIIEEEKPSNTDGNNPEEFYQPDMCNSHFTAIPFIESEENLHAEAEQRRRIRRRLWTHPYLERRESSFYRGLFMELSIEDPFRFRRCLRMNETMFVKLLRLVSPLLMKRDTNMRLAIPVEEKLAIGLRYLATDSGFKGSPVASPRKAEEEPEQAASYHCECCRKTAPGPRSFFDTETILKSNEAPWRDRLGVNEIFSNRRDPTGEALKGSWLFEGGSGGPSNFLGSTYPPPGPSEFDFKGIGIQSVGRPREVPANHGVDYCGRRRPTVSLRHRSRRMDLNKEAYYLRDDLTSTRNFSTEGVLHHLSPYNKYRYDRSLSPRKY